MEGKDSQYRRRKALRWMGRVMRWGTLFAAVFFAVVWAGGERTHYQRTFTTEKREVAIYACWGGVMVIHQAIEPVSSNVQQGLIGSTPQSAAVPDPAVKEILERNERMMARELLEAEIGMQRVMANLRTSVQTLVVCEVRLTHDDAPLGLWMPHHKVDRSTGTLAVAVPYWLITLPFASVSCVLFWLSYRRSRRAKAGHCTACNYSLVGLSPTAACPECGVARIIARTAN